MISLHVFFTREQSIIHQFAIEVWGQHTSGSDRIRPSGRMTHYIHISLTQLNPLRDSILENGLLSAQEQECVEKHVQAIMDFTEGKIRTANKGTREHLHNLAMHLKAFWRSEANHGDIDQLLQYTWKLMDRMLDFAKAHGLDPVKLVSARTPLEKFFRDITTRLTREVKIAPGFNPLANFQHQQPPRPLRTEKDERWWRNVAIVIWMEIHELSYNKRVL